MDNNKEMTAENAVQTSEHSARTSTMQFFGKGGEYFAIWIVNLLLTVLTLGIYSAWATVRNNRYFHSNTELDGHRFKYHATPMQILKGRIIALVLFATFYGVSSLSPQLAIGLLVIYFIAVPWLLVKSFKFNLQMKSYRNVRFNFHGQYGKAFLAFIVYPILSVFTLYLALPWALKEMDNFIYNNISYGDKPLKSEISSSAYYKAGFGALGIALLIFVAIIVMFGLELSSFKEGATPGLMFQLTIMGAYLAVFVVAGAFYNTVVRNHVFAQSKIDDVASFKSNLTVGSLVFLSATNLLALICSLGLALPWVKVRNARFMCSLTDVTVLSGADAVIASQTTAENAVGDELADAFDLDIAIT